MFGAQKRAHHRAQEEMRRQNEFNNFNDSRNRASQALEDQMREARERESAGLELAHLGDVPDDLRSRERAVQHRPSRVVDLDELRDSEPPVVAVDGEFTPSGLEP